MFWWRHYGYRPPTCRNLLSGSLSSRLSFLVCRFPPHVSPTATPELTTSSKPRHQNVAKEEKERRLTVRGNPTRSQPVRAKKAKSRFFGTISKLSSSSAPTATTLTIVCQLQSRYLPTVSQTTCWDSIEDMGLGCPQWSRNWVEGGCSSFLHSRIQNLFASYSYSPSHLSWEPWRVSAQRGNKEGPPYIQALWWHGRAERITRSTFPGILMFWWSAQLVSRCSLRSWQMSLNWSPTGVYHSKDFKAIEHLTVEFNSRRSVQLFSLLPDLHSVTFLVRVCTGCDPLAAEIQGEVNLQAVMAR